MSNNDYLKNSFGLWQEYTKAYTDFVMEATKQNVQASLEMRERMDKVMVELVKQAQTLSAQEQEIALQAAEAMKEQAQATAERINKMMTPPAK